MKADKRRATFGLTPYLGGPRDAKLARRLAAWLKFTYPDCVTIRGSVVSVNAKRLAARRRGEVWS